VSPVVPEIEDIDELLTLAESGELRLPLIDHRTVEVKVWVRSSDVRAIAELKLVQVRAVPPGKCVIDRCGELSE
jgi:hypothetical protein